MRTPKLIQHVKNSPSKDGSVARFVALNERWGFKFYDYKWQAHHSHHHQRQAAKHGLAPNVGSGVIAFEHVHRWSEHPETCYGYVTERIVKTLADEGADPYEFTGYPPESYGSEYADLYDCLENAGVDVSDLHAENVGRLSNGQLVCIDFIY